MKKSSYFISLCVIISLVASCSIPSKKPNGGVWYCEELKTSIDFDGYKTTNYCVKLYNDDGTHGILGCHFDYGNGIYLFYEEDGKERDYLSGYFKYSEKEELFIITSYSDGDVYIFNNQGTVL